MAALRLAVLCVAFVTLNAMNPSPGQTGGGPPQGGGNPAANLGGGSTAVVQPTQQQPNSPPGAYNYPSMNYQQQGYAGYPSMNSGYPNMNSGYPNMNYGYPNMNSAYPNMNSGYPSMNSGYPRMQTYPGMNGMRRQQPPASNLNNFFLPLALSGNDAAANMALWSAFSGGKGGQSNMLSALALGGGLGDNMQQAMLYSGLGRQGGANPFGGLPWWALSGMDFGNYLPFALGGLTGTGQGQGQGQGQGGQGRAGGQGGAMGLNNPAMLGLYLGGNF